MPTASDLLGVPVPSDAPAVLMALGAHISAGLTAVVAGAVAALTRKRRGIHPRAGLVYWWGLLWVLISSLVMGVLRWPHDIHLVAIGLIAFGAGTLGLVVRLEAAARWREVHLAAMGVSYIALLTGFYVDNGPHLPVWRFLPAWSFWILPSAIGSLVILVSLRRWRARAEDPVS
jgi:hypothetical protein